MGKRENGEGSIRRRPDGSWEARYHDAAGMRRSLYGKTAEAARRKLTAATRDRDRGVLTADGRMTVGEYLRVWLEIMRPPRIRESTWIRADMHLRIHVIPAIGKVKLTQLNPMHLHRLYAQCLAKGLAPTTVNHLHGVLHQALKDAMRSDLVPRNVAELADPPKVKKREMHIYTPEQVDSLLASVEGQRLAALVTLTIATGMRSGELLALKWSHVDLSRGMVHVKRTRSRVAKGYIDEHPKTESGRRDIKLIPLAVVALRAHKRRLAEERLRLGDAWKDEDRVFPSAVGTAIGGPNLTRQWHRIIAKAGLPEIHFHDLRHSAASWLLSKGVPIVDVSKMLGHADPSITLRIYAHAMPNSHEHVAAVMETLLRRPASEASNDAEEGYI